jgi:hypothetical protein
MGCVPWGFLFGGKMSELAIGRPIVLSREGVDALKKMLEMRDRLVRLNGNRTSERNLTKIKTLDQVPLSFPWP